MYEVKQSTALTVPVFVHDANGDAVTGLTDGSFTKRISKGSGAFAAMTVTITEKENGWYDVPLSTSHTDTLGLLSITLTNAGAKQVNIQVRVTARIKDDLAYPTTSGRSIDVTAGGEVGLDLDNTSGTIDAAQIASNAITSAKIATGAITAATFAAGAIDATAVGTGAIDADALATDAVNEIADGVWDEAVSGHTTLGSFGQILNAVGARTGEVNDASPAAGDFDVDGFTEGTNDHFNGMVLMFTSGVLTGQARVITDYVGTGQNCVFAEPFTEAPADNDDFVILPPGMITGGTLQQVLRLFITILDQATGQIDSGSFAADAINSTVMADDTITAAKIAANAIGASELATDAIGDAQIATGAIASTAFAAGAINASAIATDAITAAKIAADAIGASELATDGINEIADGMLKRDMSVGTDSGSSTVRTVRDALRFLRNKWSISGSTLTVTKEDDATTAWTAALTTDATADPVTGNNPAGGS